MRPPLAEPAAWPARLPRSSPPFRADARLLGKIFSGPDPGDTRFRLPEARPPTRPTFAVAEETAVPSSAGPTRSFAGAAALAFIGAGAVIFFLGKRRLAPLVVLVVLGLAAGGAAFAAVKAWVPPERPGVRNNRLGRTFWSEEGGRPATVMRMPVTFPPETFSEGRLLSGLGVPDLSGRIGKPSYYTSDPFFTAREGNDFSIDLVRLESNTGRQVTKISGPPGKAFGREGTIDLPLTLTVAPSRDRLTIEAGAEKRELSAGQWSDWVSLVFRVNPLISLHGYGRFRLQSVSPEIALYLSPVQFDPDRLPPGFELSSPAGFAKDLVARFGRYKTMGWAIDTWSIQSGTLREDAFLEDVAATAAQERRMLAALMKERQRLIVHYFEFPDRVAHVFWRFRDPGHPAYDAALAPKYGDAVEKSYETMDAIVGRRWRRCRRKTSCSSCPTTVSRPGADPSTTTPGWSRTATPS